MYYHGRSSFHVQGSLTAPNLKNRPRPRTRIGGNLALEPKVPYQSLHRLARRRGTGRPPSPDENFDSRHDLEGFQSSTFQLPSFLSVLAKTTLSATCALTVVCLASIVQRLECWERDVLVKEPTRPQPSAENGFEKERLASRSNCRSIIRRGPILSPSVRARSRRVRDHFRYKQIAIAARFPVRSKGELRRDYSYRCGRTDLRGRRYARSCKRYSQGGFS